MAEPNACRTCGNEFIEVFGGDSADFQNAFGEARWWCGCKPCSKRDGGPDHVTGKTREEAVSKWNERNPDQTTDRTKENPAS